MQISKHGNVKLGGTVVILDALVDGDHLRCLASTSSLSQHLRDALTCNFGLLFAILPARREPPWQVRQPGSTRPNAGLRKLWAGAAKRSRRQRDLCMSAKMNETCQEGHVRVSEDGRKQEVTCKGDHWSCHRNAIMSELLISS
eukprot:768649-Hanusia_phi.AAC.7